MRDFEKSGIHMDKNKKEIFVKYHDQILDLGDKLMNQSASAIPRITVKAGELAHLANIPKSQKYVSVAVKSHLGYMILYRARNPSLRKEMFIAMNTASKQQIHTLEELLKTRALLANLLNEKSYSHMFLKDKMAKTPGKHPKI